MIGLVKEQKLHPEATEGDHTGLLSQGDLDLMTRSALANHAATLELKALFARKGGELSRHFLTGAEPGEEIFMLEDVRSFAVLNFSSITINLGVGGASATPGNGFPVPPSSYLQLPVETNVAKIAAPRAELEGLGAAGSAEVAFIRFRHLVNLTAGPLSNSPIAGVAAVTSESPRSVAVGVTSKVVIPANSARRGLSIENTSEGAVASLGLGQAAVLGDDVVLQPAGAWDGTISGRLWLGAVNSIGTAAGSLAVVEV